MLSQDIEARITDYLSSGGLFNPELMEHEKVRDLLLDCRAALAAERENRIREDREWERSKQLDLAEIQQLRQQLAAEKSLRETAQSNAELWHEEMLKVDKQLAAEKENSRLLRENLNRTADKLADAEFDAAFPKNELEKIGALSKQLAEEKEENRILRDALSYIAGSNEDSQHLSQVATEVLNHQPRTTNQ